MFGKDRVRMKVEYKRGAVLDVDVSVDATVSQLREALQAKSESAEERRRGCKQLHDERSCCPLRWHAWATVAHSKQLLGYRIDNNTIIRQSRATISHPSTHGLDRTYWLAAARLNVHRQGLKIKQKEGDDPKKVGWHKPQRTVHCC